MLQQIDSAIAFSVVMLMLSLIITAIVQVITALADLRGRNLASGLGNLLQQMEPQFRAKLPDGSTIAQHIADVVVRHPAIAHAGTRAKAVSQSELVSVLRDLCSATPATTIDQAAKEKLRQLVEARVPGGGESAAVAQAVLQQLDANLPGQEAQIRTAVNAAFTTVSKLEYEVGQWFDTVMNRLSDIFTRTTRGITVAISLLFALLLQIDSGQILRQIAGNPELRARLTAMTDPALSQASRIFDNGDRAKSALADVKKDHSDKNTDPDKQIVAELDKDSIDLSSCVAADLWFAENPKPILTANAVPQEFRTACQNRTLQAVRDDYEGIAEIQANLKQTDLSIIPAEVGGHPVFDTIADWWASWFAKRHLAGVLASMVFLSLGAPFWFNALRQLANLKPAIAGKVQQAQSS